MKGITVETLSTEPELLVSLARDVVETVELRIEDGAPRLVLAFESSLATDGSKNSEYRLSVSIEPSAASDDHGESHYTGISLYFIDTMKLKSVIPFYILSGFDS